MYFELCISYTEGQDNQQTKHEFEVEAVLHQKEKYTHKKKPSRSLQSKAIQSHMFTEGPHLMEDHI